MYHKENGERIAFSRKLWYVQDRKGRKGDFYEYVRCISDVRYYLCMCNYFGDASDLCCNLLSGVAACPKRGMVEGNDSADRFSAAWQRRSISGDYFIGDLWASAE